MWSNCHRRECHTNEDDGVVGCDDHDGDSDDSGNHTGYNSHRN